MDLNVLFQFISDHEVDELFVPLTEQNLKTYALFLCTEEQLLLKEQRGSDSPKFKINSKTI